jgi:hypothetical protein
MTFPRFDDYMALSPAGRLLLAARNQLTSSYGIVPDRTFLALSDDQQTGEHSVRITVLPVEAAGPKASELTDPLCVAECGCTCECQHCGECEHFACTEDIPCSYAYGRCTVHTAECDHPAITVDAEIADQRDPAAAEAHILEFTGRHWTYTNAWEHKVQVRSNTDPFHDYDQELTEAHAAEMAAFLADQISAFLASRQTACV